MLPFEKMCFNCFTFASIFLGFIHSLIIRCKDLHKRSETKRSSKSIVAFLNTSSISQFLNAWCHTENRYIPILATTLFIPDAKSCIQALSLEQVSRFVLFSIYILSISKV